MISRGRSGKECSRIGNSMYRDSGALGIWQDRESKHCVPLGVKRDRGQPLTTEIEKPHQFKQGQYEGNRNKRNKVDSS